ncbi:hypothetical protein AB0C77_33550 [Streptomyces sp. NPDC048629]|uniref:hypothetical protein n=1 Tax=Streptomyces sp. NPDC048629 TaxID=3154824 RepID=UPI003429A8C3
MTTDYACQAAAEQAGDGITHVRALLVPARPSAAPEDDLPVMYRHYLGVPGRAPDRPEPDMDSPVVRESMGAAMLLVFLDGLRAELQGALPDWYAGLQERIPQALGAPGRGRGPHPVRPLTESWAYTTALQQGAHEVLTALRGCASVAGSAGSNALAVRVALVEDVLCGALKRLTVPWDTAALCAGALAAATASLYGISVTPPQRADGQPVHREG